MTGVTGPVDDQHVGERDAVSRAEEAEGG
jgi:hypothetical protein